MTADLRSGGEDVRPTSATTDGRPVEVAFACAKRHIVATSTKVALQPPHGQLAREQSTTGQPRITGGRLAETGRWGAVLS